MVTVERMHCLIATGRGFDLFTDHDNLIFHFGLTAVVVDLSQITFCEVL